MAEVRIGQTLKSSSDEYTIKSLLGSGGQGSVYLVLDGKGRERALKWYNDASATNFQRNVICDLIARGSPAPMFLWPEDFVEEGNNFGYIMPVRPAEYVSLHQIVKRTTELSFFAVVRAANDMTYAFRQLHTAGLAYRDISYGNMFIHPQTGEVLICDNDNVSASTSEETSVYGTMQFMAPEIVLGKAKPSTQTDRYSLAVLLFLLLCLNHPLQGKLEYDIHALNEAARKRLYGSNPVFIFDPNDHSNDPVKGWNDNAIIYWPLYPDYVQKLFIKAFTEGLKNPSARVTEGEWLKAFRQLLASLCKCKSCGAEVFYDPSNRTKKCWNCDSQLGSFSVLDIEGHYFVIDQGKELYACDTTLDDKIPIGNPIGVVVANPQKPDVVGLKNCDAGNWNYTGVSGTQSVIVPGKTAALKPGVTFHFGRHLGIVK